MLHFLCGNICLVRFTKYRLGNGEDLSFFNVRLSPSLPPSAARVGHVVCADIAETSVQQAKERYNRNRSVKEERMLLIQLLNLVLVQCMIS